MRQCQRVAQGNEFAGFFAMMTEMNPRVDPKLFSGELKLQEGHVRRTGMGKRKECALQLSVNHRPHRSRQTDRSAVPHPAESFTEKGVFGV